MIHLVVSRPAEARPLVEHLGLIANGGGAYPVYRGEHRGENLALAVAGEGKLAAAAATAHLHLAAGGVGDGGWLNVGVAGHAELEIGRGVLAHKVVDAGSGDAWYPPMLLEDPGPGASAGVGTAAAIPTELTTATVVTAERLEGEYDGGAAYDTAASGFFAAAGRVAGVELVHAFKVVVDNHAATLGDNFGPAVVEDLVRSKLELLKELLSRLGELVETARARRPGGLEVAGVEIAGRRDTQRRAG